MHRLTRRAALALLAALCFSTAALAIYPKLSTSLVGPSLNGVVPTGQAKVDQSKLPAVPGTGWVEVRSVNLPDGTLLPVELDGYVVGSIRLSRGQGALAAQFPGMVGRGSSRLNVWYAGVVILTNPGAWKT